MSSASDAGPAGETGADESEMVDFVVETPPELVWSPRSPELIASAVDPSAHGAGVEESVASEDYKEEVPKEPREANKKKIPVDHFLTHQPALSSCDVCRQAKLRTHPHRRFPHQVLRQQK